MNTWLQSSGDYYSQTKTIFLLNDLQQKKSIDGFNVVFTWQKKKHPEYSQISTQNKINFIDGMRDLSECVVYGLYVLFNSTLYDCYYRILNGSTQVNSTEVNSMPVPSMDKMRPTNGFVFTM